MTVYASTIYVVLCRSDDLRLYLAVIAITKEEYADDGGSRSRQILRSVGPPRARVYLII